ncbi:MAG: hypothetical protein UU23_C0001G0125 [Candidatus Curtissbacteria bacterium GW2011_GWA1_40_9]|uniref:N-acetyltransferase domain-containing protein n=1 Tax=Candidatus Curtissbacteria bacterium GW2011_GWA1_40_9 TaxID=1618408 RepID=A0A0G0TU51_9BACT|nr:MAG: hypothetical protein UU23_C0001G0125 [Candidatus Curtissbacteria bacterium GW2011_GWA1_40_9]
MSKEVRVAEATVDDAVRVNATVIEFDEPYDQRHFEERINGKNHLILVGSVDGKPAGYMVSYEDERYPNSFYLWMAGVNPENRGQGVLKALMEHQESWAKEKGYAKLILKTRNERREMLSFLVKYDWNFIEVMPKEKIENTEILVEKVIA